MTALLVVLGAAVGAPSRWHLDRYVQSRRAGVFPWGTFTVNVSGSFLLGVILGARTYGPETADVATLIGAGFCGGFTTLSTLTFETARLVEDGSYLEAGANVVGSMAAGLVAALAGWYLARFVWG